MFVTDFSVGIAAFTPESAREDIDRAGLASGLWQLRALAGLCNAAQFDAASMKLPLAERQIYGDATDQAILRLSERLGPVSELYQLWAKTYELAFSSKNKFMIRTFRLAELNGRNVLSATEATQFQPDDM
jgi:sodium/potassium-transporting ATPase subunit alpha